MFKKLLLSILTIMMLAAALVGCQKATEVQKTKELETIRYIGFKVYDPVYVAKDKGFFEENNLNVEIVDLISAGPNALQMISGGDAEMGLSSTMAIINARSQGMPIMAISDLQSSIGDQPLEEFFVRKDSGINFIEDLRGKKIAINLVKSSFHYTWLMALEEAGISENEVEWVILPFDQQELALKNGQVDAIGLMQPYIGHTRAQEDFKVLYTALDVFGEKQFCPQVINNVWAKENPEAVKAFVKTMAETTEWIEENQDEAREIIAKYTGMEAQYIEDYHFQENAMVVEEDAEFWLNYMREKQGLKCDWLEVKDFVTNEYNERVKK